VGTAGIPAIPNNDKSANELHLLIPQDQKDEKDELGDEGTAHRALNQLIGSPRPHFCFGCCAGWCAMRPITELSATSLTLKCVCARLGPFPRPSIRHGARCTFPYTRKRIFNLTQAKNCVTDTLVKYYDDYVTILKIKEKHVQLP